MKELNESLSINGNLFYPWIEIEKDGKTIYSKRGNSLLGNWIISMYAMMSGSSVLTDGLPKVISNRGSSSSYSIDDTYYLTMPVSIARVEEPPASGTYQTKVLGDNGAYWRALAGVSYDFFVQIMGIGNGSSFGDNVNGYWELEETTHGVSGSYWIKDAGSLPATYPDLLATGAIDTTVCSPHVRAVPSSTYVNSGLYPVQPRTREMGYGQIRLGYNGDANIIEQRWPNAEIPKTTTGAAFCLSNGAITVVAPVVGATTSVLEIQQTFTNSNGATPAQDITFNEVGYYGVMAPYAEFTGDHILLGRDVVAPTIIAGGGGAVTIKYQFIIAAGVSSGVMATLNELLYRKFSGVSREVKDIDNSNQDEVAQPVELCAASIGGLCSAGSSYLELGGGHVGVQVGHSTKNISNTDFRLQYAAGDTVYDGSIAAEGQDSRYEHGEEVYQLYIFGSLVDNLEIDTSADKASFDITRFFWNKNGSPFRKVLTVAGGAGTLRVDIDGVDYDQVYGSSADATAAAWVATHAATLLGLSNSIVATDSGVAEITMTAPREFVTTDQSIGGMSFGAVETRDDIEINESAIYVGIGSVYGGPGVKYAVCVIKNKLGAPIYLPHDETLKVVYTIEVNV